MHTCRPPSLTLRGHSHARAHPLSPQARRAPIYQLLGGKVRDKIRVYAWVGGDRPSDVETAAYVCLRGCLPVYLPTCLLTYLSTYLPVYLHTYPSTYLSTYLST